MEVKYDEEDLVLILLCSLPSSYSNFKDTILYSRDTLTLNEVYEALHAKKKMKEMVFAKSSSSQAEGWFVRGRQKEKGSYSGSRGKSSSGYRGHAKSRVKGDKLCNYCNKDNHYITECYKLKNKEKQNSISKSRGKTEDESKKL